MRAEVFTSPWFDSDWCRCVNPATEEKIATIVAGECCSTPILIICLRFPPRNGRVRSQVSVLQGPHMHPQPRSSPLPPLLLAISPSSLVPVAILALLALVSSVLAL